jgi:hypothetical protein
MGAETAQVTGASSGQWSGAVVPDDGILPVLPALRELLPAGGLQRGSVIATGRWSLLCLALAAGASAAGAWCAIAGIPELGVRAAADAGLDPGRMLLIAEPGASWPQVVASLLDGCELVLLRPPDRPSAQVRRRLEAVIRRRGSVLVVAGDWDGAQSRLLVTDQEWAGIGAGHGRLRARRVQVVASGRGSAARPRARWLWLPGPDGSVTAATEGRPAAADAAVSRAAISRAVGGGLAGGGAVGGGLAGGGAVGGGLAGTHWKYAVDQACAAWRRVSTGLTAGVSAG